MFGNILLIYLIIKQTPKGLRPYAVLIMNFAITDLFACFLGIFVMQRFVGGRLIRKNKNICRIIPDGVNLSYISYGLCAYISPFSCVVGYAFMLHCFAHSLNSMVISSAYRLWVLFKVAMFLYSLFNNAVKQGITQSTLQPAPTITKVVFAVILVYLPSLFQAVSFLLLMEKCF